jgi:hypothetical protein
MYRCRLFSNGFPKNRDKTKPINKAIGEEIKVVRHNRAKRMKRIFTILSC